MDERIELKGVLSLDTTQAEAKLKGLKSGESSAELVIPKDAKIKLPKSANDAIKNLFSTSSGFGRMTRVLSGSMHGVQGLTGSLLGMASSAGKAGLILATVALALKAISALFKNTDTLEKMNSAWGDLKSKIKEVFAPIVALIGEGVLMLIDSMKQFLPVLKVLVLAIKPLIELLIGVSKMLAPVRRLVGKILELVQPIVSLLSELVSGALVSILDLGIRLVEFLLKPLIEFIEFLTKAFVAFSSALKQVISVVTFGLVKFNKSLASTEGKEKKEKEGYNSTLDTFVTSGKKDTEKYAEKTAEAAKDTKESALTFLEAIKGMKENFAGVKQAIQDSWQNLKTSVQDSWNGFKEGVKSSWEGVKESLAQSWASLKEGVQASWQGMKERVKESWESLKEGVKSSWDGMKEAVKESWNGFKEGVKSAWDGMKSFFSSVAGTIKEAFAGFGAQIKEKATESWNKTKESAANTGEKVKNFFGGLGDRLRKRIRGYADGGTLTGQVWQMNEKGNPEFIFRGGGHDSVINKDILAEALYTAIMRSKIDEKDKQIVMKVDGSGGVRQLVDLIMPYIRVVLRREENIY